MQRIVFMQFLAMLVIAAIFGLLVDTNAMLSALLGGGCCLLPNGFFAWRLHVVSRCQKNATPLTYFVVEFCKIAMTLALMGAVIGLYHDVNWLAFVVGCIVVLKSYLFLLFTRTR